MELKLVMNIRVDLLLSGSNRTFMELKFGIAVNDFVDEVCSNRTFMELKLLFPSSERLK